MDMVSLILGGVAAVALVVSLVLWRRLATVENRVATAVSRIGGEPSDEPVAALDSAVASMAQTLDDVHVRRLQYHGAVFGAEFGILVVDPDGTVEVANPAAEQLLDAHHGHAVAEVRLRELVRRVAESQMGEVLDLDLFTPRRRALRLRGLPLARGDETLGVVVYIEDLSERQRVDVMRKDFVANVSHELKTPLGALAVLAETLEDADDPEVRRQLAGRLGEEAKRMALLVDDILDLSHLESGGTQREPVVVHEVFAEVLRQSTPAATAHEISVTVEPPDPDLAFHGDRLQIVSALVNLVDNAIKYTAAKTRESGGAVWVRPVAEPGWVTIEVEDRGIGIPELHRDRIFERFYRVDRGRSRASGGTGLGLSIVRHVALNHGGQVTVASEAGAGSTFRLRLPRWEP